MSTKRRSFCVETYRLSMTTQRSEPVSRRCGFTYKQAESAARRAFLTKAASTAHVVTAAGMPVSVCYRTQAGYDRKARVECRKTGGHARIGPSYRLAELVEGAPGYNL